MSCKRSHRQTEVASQCTVKVPIHEAFAPYGWRGPSGPDLPGLYVNMAVRMNRLRTSVSNTTFFVLHEPTLGRTTTLVMAVKSIKLYPSGNKVCKRTLTMARCLVDYSVKKRQQPAQTPSTRLRHCRKAMLGLWNQLDGNRAFMSVKKNVEARFYFGLRIESIIITRRFKP